MNNKTLKNTFLREIKPFYKAKGYAYSTDHISKFQLKTDKYVVMSYYEFLDRKPAIRGGGLSLCLWEVENVILDIQFPNQGFECYLTKKTDFFTTTWDRSLNCKIGEQVILDTNTKIIEATEAVKSYIETDGQKFIDHYSYLPNILAEMDKLEKEGKGWHKVLSGNADHFFRGLIISKLCNDPHLEEKIEFCNSKFNSIQLLIDQGWIPYYNKLKEHLKTLEPIYNV